MENRAAEAGVRLVIEGHVAQATLDRPDRHNAVEAEDVSRLRTFLEEVDADPEVRVLVLTGTGETTFCSGASLPQIESGEMSGALFATLTERLAEARVPTICALNGSVFGGGAELALCCDFRVGVTGSRLRVTASKLGICYPVEGLERYVRRLGPGTAARILLAAEELDAEEMLRVGFLTHCTDREKLLAEVAAMARRLAALAPLAVQSMKRILRGVERADLDPAEARRLIEACEGSSDLAEGLAAWRERREPDFEGK